MAERPAQPKHGQWQRFMQTVAPLTLLLGLLLLFQWQTKGLMLSASNLSNVAYRNAPLALVAIGITPVIIAAHIDLSVGSVMALGAVSAGLLFRDRGVPFEIAALLSIIIGLICGVVSGLITTKTKMPSFVATLAMMGFARGLALVISKSQTVGGDFSFMARWMNAPLMGLRPSLWLVLGTVVIAHVLLRYTTFGRAIYAIGANDTAAHLSGIRTSRVVVTLFALEGALFGLAGLVNLMQNASAEPTMATGIELDAIAAAVIGGASLAGGQGSVGGTLIGVAIMATLINGCNLLNVPNEWSKVIVAILIVLGVSYDRWLRTRTQAAARQMAGQ